LADNLIVLDLGEIGIIMKNLLRNMVLFCILLGSCATSDMIQVTRLRSPLDPVSTNSIEVFIGESIVTKKYEQIAIINADDEGWEKSDSELIHEMKRRAAQLGASAIIIVGQETNPNGGVIVNNVFVQSNRKMIKAIAIHFQDDVVSH